MSACRRDPTLSFCEQTATNSQPPAASTAAPVAASTQASDRLREFCEAQAQVFVTRCIEPISGTIARSHAAGCVQIARRCDYPENDLPLPRAVSGFEALPDPPATATPALGAGSDAERCAAYKSTFDDICSRQSLPEEGVQFCPDYAKVCNVQQNTELPRFCEIYQDDFDKQCLTEVVEGRYTQFCSDYGITCRRRPGATAGQNSIDESLPKVDCSNAAEFNRFTTSCRKSTIASDDRSFCIAGHRQCSWQLGTPANGGTPSGQTRTGPANAEEARAICKANEEQARRNCFTSSNVKAEHVRPCAAFVRDCMDYYEDDEPLRKAASLFSSRVGVGTNDGVSGIPFYPFNPEGNVFFGETTGADFGTWGGTARSTSGVSDFWQLTEETGANWYEGEYGTRDSWGVPIFPAASGSSGTQVTVPINERTLGNPIGVNDGLGVGPWWGQGEGTSVDWLNGNVGTGDGWSLPFLGIGGGSTSNVQFPSFAQFAPLLASNGRK